ncbi:SCP-like protein [Ancylostoma caninum]|uniref:SCP-like protein n=1 Tax=Ancylostoma caninum TaxID=29170 RepID=A0A368GSE1_ANCCA|nr:SCP-like protein [Ancylostoma caninum]
MPSDATSTTELVTESTVAESESTAAPETKSTAAPATESTAAAAETTAQSSGGMTQELRDKVVNMHNYYRSMLARGLVRNGKVGNPNCPQATNMYKMRYDMAMESEAQMYADSCPARGSQVSARPSLSGENFQIFNSVIISPNDAITHALDTWWTQILKNGVNNQMKYNEYLEMKEQAPIAFTQVCCRID